MDGKTSGNSSWERLYGFIQQIRTIWYVAAYNQQTEQRFSHAYVMNMPPGVPESNTSLIVLLHEYPGAVHEYSDP